MKSPDYIHVTLPRPIDAGAGRQYDTLRLSVIHRHAGINIAGNPYPAGHALSFTPCTINAHGFMESTLWGADQWTSGFLMPLNDMPRKNPYYIARAMRLLDDMKEHIAEAFSERNGARLAEMTALIDARSVKITPHVHTWGPMKEGDNGEKIQWCETCEATRDSDGGIIE